MFYVILIALLFMASQLCDTFNWSGVFAQVQRSVIRVKNQQGNTCTAFSINQQMKYYLTAFHCLTDNMRHWKEMTPEISTQAGTTVGKLTLLKFSKELDIAVLQGELSLPALRYGSAPRLGAEVAVIGYAGGLLEPSILLSNVLHVMDAHPSGNSHMLIIRDDQDYPGMSGSPVVNFRGQVVSMCHRGAPSERGDPSDDISSGTAIRDILGFVDHYWEK